MADPILLAKAAAAVLSDERTRKAAGWVLAATLSPIILLIAFFCALGSGTTDHNISAAELCFYGGTLPEGKISGVPLSLKLAKPIANKGFSKVMTF